MWTSTNTWKIVLLTIVIDETGYYLLGIWKIWKYVSLKEVAGRV